jgi:hypothetical protein
LTIIQLTICVTLRLNESILDWKMIKFRFHSGIYSVTVPRVFRDNEACIWHCNISVMLNDLILLRSNYITNFCSCLHIVVSSTYFCFGFSSSCVPLCCQFFWIVHFNCTFGILYVYLHWFQNISGIKMKFPIYNLP